MSRSLFVSAVLLLSVTATVFPQSKTGTNYAFLVACSEYTEKNELSRLPFTVAETEEFKTVLEKTGFDPKDIKFMRDGAERRYIPERSKILEEFKLLLARVEAKDTLVVALNGHGVHFRKDKSGYFCPLDASLGDKKTMIAMDDGEDNLFSLLKACRAKKKLLIVNACRNDPSSFGLAARKLEFDNESDEEVPEGIVGIYSCKPGQRSYYYNPADPKSPSKTRSLFFHHLIESWSGAHSRTGKVTLEEVFQHVKSKTATDADELHGQAQVPDIKREYAGEWLVRNESENEKSMEVEIAKGVKMKFCWIPAGECQLGSPKDEQEHLVKTQFDGRRPDWLDGENESARGKYRGEGFWLGKYPVTQKEYESITGSNLSRFKGDRLPVETVSWDDAQACMRKMNEGGAGVELRKAMGEMAKFALPHEDAWEYACRGGRSNKQAFFWGDSLNGDKSNCDGLSPYGTQTKGSYLRKTSDVNAYMSKVNHPWGLCDTNGNVYQWCDNLYAASGSDRVFRGGGWSQDAVYCRSAYRNWLDPSSKYNYLGFRLVVSVG